MGWQAALKEIVELIKAITPLAWPLLALYAIMKFLPHMDNILAKNEGKIEFGSFKLSYGETAERLNSQVKDLQDQIIKLERVVSGDPLIEIDNSERKEKNNQKFFILWVDDYPSNNALIIDRFMKQGIDVSISVSTEDALIKIDSYEFDLIISDLGRYENGMERPMAGLELVDSIRKKGEKMPLLIFAGRRGIENRDKLLAAGATNVTDSPTQVVEFVDNIRLQKLS